MSIVAAKSRFMLSVACAAALLLAGCGGAESRKARHLKNGQAFLAAENFEKARIEFRNALQIAPTDSEARFENGVVDEKLGNPREAAQFYQGAIDSNADNVGARAALARLYLFSGAPDQALDLIKPALVTHPMDARLLTVRAAVRVQLKDPDGALQDAEEAVKLAPTNEDAVAVLAGVYKSRNEPEKARAILESSIKLIPNSVDLRLALAQLYSSMGLEPQVEALLIDLTHLKPKEKSDRLRLAQYYTRLNRLDEAEHVLREATKALPNERDLKIALIDFLAARRGRDAADKELTAMIAANPKDYGIRLAQAQFFEQGKDYPKAEATYQRIIVDADPSPPAMTARDRLAALKIQNKDIPGAEKLLAEVLAKSPRDNDALILRGNLALAQKDPKSAIVDLRAVLRDQPNAVGVMRTLARAHLANGEPALAEETMRRAADVNAKDVGARLDLAQLLAQIGKPDQAKPVIDELVKREPNNLSALDTQFRVDAATGDVAGAKMASDAIVALQPNSGLGYYYQGATAESMKHQEEAARLYSVALDKQPDSSEALQALSLVLVKLNRTPEALKRLDDASAKFPSLPLALNVKGDILLVAQHPAEAAVAFQGAIERTPTWWLPYRGLARAQSAGHDDAAAMATLQSGISKATQPESLEIDLARMFEVSGKADDAIKLYETTLRQDPHSDVAANNLAMVLVTFKTDRPSLDRAKDLAQRFSSSPNTAFLDTYGWVLYKRGDSSAAVSVLQSVLSKAPESPVALYHLGMAQASAGQPDAARENLTLSLKSGKAFPGMDEAKATLDKLAKLSAITTSIAPRS
jgi:tetratricopeptide (TPR) repeat protein